MKFRMMALSLMLWAGWMSGAAVAITSINGAGASFPYPLYTKWVSEFQKTNPDVQINYQSIGSGGGIKQTLEGTVDFGATDAPMTDEQLKKATSPILHIPTVMGAVVITYNLPGIKELKLTGEVVADIFLGKITKWNDPRIKKLNATENLPDKDILVAHRADGSGTTNIFTDYLSKVSPEWKTKVGTGTAVNWPVGTGGKGNEGVTSAVKGGDNTIGYVELIYAENNKLPYATMKNLAGNFVKPTLKSVTAAAASVKTMPEDFRVSITNAAGAESYPVSGFTYLLVPKTPKDAVKGAKLVKFLRWALADGQAFADKLTYSPLPKELAKKVEAKIDTIVVPKTVN
jgi:phosphate transport system substrate-binding protein